MDAEILAKLSELKLHIDQRLDEIVKLCQSSGCERRSSSPLITPSKTRTVLYANSSDSNEAFLLDLAPKIPEVSKPKQQSPKPLPCINQGNGIVKNLPDSTSETSSSSHVEVEYDKFVNIQLSYVFSARSFYLHLNYEEVEKFYLNFNEYYVNLASQNASNLNEDLISIKQLCCVYNEDDMSYYRARVLKESNGSYLVRFVDFGDIKLVEPKSMFQLIPEFSHAPIFALHCYLNDSWTNDLARLESVFLELLAIPNSYCFEIRAKFQRCLPSDKLPVMIQIKATNNGPWQDIVACNFEHVPVAEPVAKFIFDFKDFTNNYLTSDSFAKSNEAYRKLSTLCGIGFSETQSFSGFCTNSSDISCFIFSLSSSIEFTTNMSFYYRGLVEDICPTVAVNSLVVFGIKNKFFFRGFVLDGNSQTYDVFSVDFGFIIPAEKDEIYPLFEGFSLQKFPPFSALCALDNIVPMLDSWSPVAVKTFKTFVQGTFTIYPRNFSNGSHSVEVEMANKNRATEMLKKFKLGKAELI